MPECTPKTFPKSAREALNRLDDIARAREDGERSGCAFNETAALIDSLRAMLDTEWTSLRSQWVEKARIVTDALQEYWRALVGRVTPKQWQSLGTRADEAIRAIEYMPWWDPPHENAAPAAPAEPGRAGEARLSESAPSASFPIEPTVDPTAKFREPDQTGYVKAPTDPSAYVSAAVVLTKHTPNELGVLSAKELSKGLRNYKTNRVRWTRPPGKDGKPRRNRLNVHLADWIAFADRVGRDGWPRVSEAEVAERTALLRSEKAAGK